MSKQSAGILVYRYQNFQIELLLVHPGGPFYVKRDLGVWSIPKGEYEDGEDPCKVAKREFQEETGNVLTSERMIPLTSVKSKGGKILHVWATEGEFENAFISSNHFELEWPPRSGKLQSFPEVDKAEWFSSADARLKIFPYQIPIIDQLEHILGSNGRKTKT